MKVGSWSPVAGNNTSTPPDGFPEGQVTSSFNDGMREIMASVKTALQDIDYFDQGITPTFVNANSFSLVGDQTSRLTFNRQLKLFDSGNTIYRTVQTASFTAVTTVQLRSGTAITSSLSSFAIGILNPTLLPPPADAYVNFSYAGTAVTVGQSYNVSSVSVSGTGECRVTFISAMPVTTYLVNVFVPGYSVFEIPCIRSLSNTLTTCRFRIQSRGALQVLNGQVNCVFTGG